MQLKHRSAPRWLAHVLSSAIWAMAIAPTQVLLQREPTEVTVQSGSTVHVFAAAQRAATSPCHCARPSRHACGGSWQTPQQASGGVNISWPAGQVLGQVSRWHTGGGMTGMAS
jgi:hypothetical protein